MQITLKQLKLLRAIAEHKTITRAAQEANLSQPAVSLQMKQLEEEVGEPIWEKDGRRFHMTHAGEVLLEAAEDVLSRLDQLREEVESSRGQVTGLLDIAVVTSAKYFLPGFIGEFMRLYPKVKPRLTVTNRASVLEAMKENRHDLYILGQIPEQIEVEAMPFLDNILEVMAPAGHELCDVEAVPLKRIAEENFLVREAGSGTRNAVERLFARKGIEINPFMELGSTGAIKNAVIAGLGIAVLSRHALDFELDAGAACLLDVEEFPIHRRWYAAYPAGRHLPIAARTFFDFLIQRMEGEEATD